MQPLVAHREVKKRQFVDDHTARVSPGMEWGGISDCGLRIGDLIRHRAWSMGHGDKARKAGKARKGKTLRIWDVGCGIAPCALCPEP
jgi:hypothetical protein